ncbi:MAG: hypothetical protein MPJ50_05750, partial [Pirellulales bacterium]|nr:hypothetical protein [Pirellulales bacterium]
MRLTLRTLLAYMDGVLDSEDAEELGRKIEESEYATEIVHRTRDVVRRLRLGAPPIDPRGQGLDANSVAEYLDNTLSPERVSDFEALCLDTDLHLAEVAGSHQILTYVLGAPAEVDPGCRQRMYGLISPSDQKSEAATSPVTAARTAKEAADSYAPAQGSTTYPADDDQLAPHKRPVEVPDYLRDPPPAPKIGRIIALALILIVTGAIIIGMQPGWLPDFLTFGDVNKVAQRDGTK